MQGIAKLKIYVFALVCLLSVPFSETLSCFQCHGTSISDVTSSCWGTVNEEHARFVSMVGCDGGSCVLVILNHTSIGLVDYTRTCEYDCQDSCFDAHPIGSRLCKYCCKSDRCNAALPDHKEEKYENVSSASGGNLRKWMTKLFAKDRHHSTGPSNKFHMRHEILKLMREFLPEVHAQEMAVSEVHQEDRAPENFRSYIRTTSRGFNLIGILPGTHYYTSAESMIVIMAHYDTFPGTPGANDNGSGVSVLLELARLFRKSECNRANTIVFVATDFKEHGIYRSSSTSNQSECIPYGTYVHNVGATYFVCEWLLPHLRANGGKLSMAINMDTVMNVYDSRSTRRENWPKSFVRTLKSYKPYGRTFLKEAKKRRFSSDWWMVKASTSAFQRVFSTSNTMEQNLRNHDFLYLQMDTSDKKIKFSQMNELLHEDDCAPFHEIQDIHLPCMTISDTGKYRGYMKRCFHMDCDTVSELNDGRLSSLVALTTAMMNTVSELAQSQCDEDSSSPTESTNVHICNEPLIQNRHQRDIFMSATCSRNGATLEMCPSPGAVWATINSDTAWIPRKVKFDESPLWFQVDFTEAVNITAIAIQGVPRKGYVRSYMVSHSNDETDWEWIIPETSQWDSEMRRVEFRGNSNSRGTSKQDVRPALTTRFIRIFPRWWRQRIAMRIQLYGCRLGEM